MKFKLNCTFFAVAVTFSFCLPSAMGMLTFNPEECYMFYFLIEHKFNTSKYLHCYCLVNVVYFS